MPRPGSVRRRQAGVLLVGAVEPELASWLRAEGCATRSVRTVAEALDALEAEPAALVIVDRESRGLDAGGACRALREDPRLLRHQGPALQAPAPQRRAGARHRKVVDDDRYCIGRALMRRG